MRPDGPGVVVHPPRRHCPLSEDDLERTADLLGDFAENWEAVKDDPEEQHNLIKLIVERVYVWGKEM